MEKETQTHTHTQTKNGKKNIKLHRLCNQYDDVLHHDFMSGCNNNNHKKNPSFPFNFVDSTIFFCPGKNLIGKKLHFCLLN